MENKTRNVLIKSELPYCYIVGKECKAHLASFLFTEWFWHVLLFSSHFCYLGILDLLSISIWTFWLLLSGLLHISNISRGQITSVSDLLAVDEKVKVLVVKSMFPDKISLRYYGYPKLFFLCYSLCCVPLIF